MNFVETKLLFATFLHIYQPEEQYPDVLERIVNESYRPIFKFLLDNPNIRVTFNINSILTTLWDKYGYIDLIESVRILLKRCQIELTESARYHAFLPLLPREEVIRQIKLNNKTHKKYFGEFYNPIGFFSPEMSYSSKIVSVINELGYKYILADEIAYNGKLDQVDFDTVYQVGDTGVEIYFRNKRISNLIMGAVVRDADEFVGILRKEFPRDSVSENNSLSYVLTAMDGETFGHHRKGLELFLFDLLKSSKIKTITIAEIKKYVKKVNTVNPVDSTWASSEQELAQGAPFGLWFDKNNKIHQLQWELTSLALGVVRDAYPRDSVSERSAGHSQSSIAHKAVSSDWRQKKDISQDSVSERSAGHSQSSIAHKAVSSDWQDKNWNEARELLDSSLHSCHYWWASAKPWWSLEMIEQGAFKMWQVVDILFASSKEQKDRAYRLYQEILMTAFSWQRTGYVRRVSEQEKQWRKIPFIERGKPGEYKALIELLKKSEQKASKSRQYEQAIRWRDAIHKLETKLDVYDAVHVIDQLRAEEDFKEYEYLIKKYAKQYYSINPGQPEK